MVAVYSIKMNNNFLKNWVPLAVVITIMSGLVYLSVQQNYRSSANDPQIQIVEDLVQPLINGQQVNLPQNKVDLKKSLATFIIITDDSGKPLFSSAILDGETPSVPPGVLDYAKENGQHQVTWQPEGEVRVAIVVQAFTDLKNSRSGYVIAGRSLRETEKRTRHLLIQVGFGWTIALAAAFVSAKSSEQAEVV